MSAALARSATALALALVAAQFFWLYQDLRDQKLRLEARQSLRRLAALTIRNFPLRDLDSPELFWKSIGREDKPMLDMWGTPYRLVLREEAGKRAYSWSSAGPDARFGTKDDVVVAVPYPDTPGTFLDTDPAGSDVPPPLSNDAK